MIQYWLGDLLKAEFPGNRKDITVDYLTERDTNIVVYYEGSSAPGRFDINRLDLNYMVWVESKDWGFAEYVANRIFDMLHKYHEKHGRPLIEVEHVNANMEVLATEMVKLHRVFAAGHINPLGVEDGKMQYTINFETTITKEEHTND